MARQDRDFIAQRIKLLLDAAKEQIAIAPRQIPAPHSTCEQNISANEELILPQQEAETARAMAGHFQHLHLEAEKIAGRGLFDQEIRLDRFDLQFESEAAEEIAILNHRRSLGMAPDLAAEALLDLRHIRDVVEMPVREQEHRRRGALRDQPVTSPVGRVE